MFQSAKSRLATVASAAWLVGAYFWIPEHYDGRSPIPEYLALVALGWAVLWLGIYGAYWVIDAPKEPLRLPAFPKWAGYALILLMVFLIMGLPKALFN